MDWCVGMDFWTGESYRFWCCRFGGLGLGAWEESYDAWRYGWDMIDVFWFIELDMKNLVVVLQGSLGQLVFSDALTRPFSYGLEVTHGLLRLTNTFTSPQVLVHCAANRFPDKVDADPEGTRLLNVEATRTLAKACASRGILLIYISTDYVFSGKPGEAPYEADAATGPANLYGVTKLDGEKAVMEEFSKAGKEGLGVVMRVPVLYGKTEEGRNEESAVNVLLDAVFKAQEGKKVKMDHWALRFPTNTEDVGRVARGKLWMGLQLFPTLLTLVGRC